MSKSTKYSTETLKNKKMSDEVYKLRRRVMTLIYEIKEFADIPRIDIRITDDDAEFLGVARLQNNIIWITERAITSDEYDLRTIVYHEVLHAVYGIGHDDECPLMRTTHMPLEASEAKKHFLKYINR